MKIPLLTNAYKSRSVNITAEERINLFPEKTGVDKYGSPVYSIIGTPGTSLFVTLGDAPVRGMIRSANGTFVAVAGSTVYTITSGGTATNIGTIGTTSGLVKMADNGAEVMITDGNLAYYTDLSTVTEISDLTTIISDNSYDGPVWCTAQDGYLMVAFPNSQNWHLSAVDDASSWSSLDFVSADGRPGYIKAIISHRDELFVLKDSSYEWWYNSGNADFPFERHQGAEGEIGTFAQYSVDRIDNNLFFMGANEQGQGRAFIMDGYTPITITNSDMSYIFSKMTDVTDCEAYTYQKEGHVFYVLNFETDDQTWVYDVTEGLWHRRGYLNNTTNALERQRGHLQCHFNQKDYVGDYESGNIYELDSDTYTDNSQEIQRTLTLPHVKNKGKRLFISNFQLEMETGVGLQSGQGSDPQAMLYISKDGGHTWFGGLWNDIGVVGDYETRVKWHRLGSAVSAWTPKIVISDPVKIVITGAYINV